LTRNAVENAVRSAPDQHQTYVSTQKASVKPNFSREAIESAVRSALVTHIPLAPVSTQKASVTQFSREAIESAVRSALVNHMPQNAASNRVDDEYDRVKIAVCRAVEKHMPRANTASTSSARGNQMREMLY
jgi:hypothetical protein